MSAIDEPKPRCSKHIASPSDSPCRACMDAREYRDEWVREKARAEGDARSREARQNARVIRQAIDRCGMCGPDGYLLAGIGLCHHDPHAAERTRRGAELVRAAAAAYAAQQTQTTED